MGVARDFFTQLSWSEVGALTAKAVVGFLILIVILKLLGRYNGVRSTMPLPGFLR
jgi:hypothetical protein